MILFLLFILWLAPTVRYRYEAGSFSFAFMEPVALLIITILIIRSLRRNRIVIHRSNLIQVSLIFILWIAIIRPFGEDWKHGLSDIRDWIIPILAFTVLISTVNVDWRKVSLWFVSIGLIHALIGIYQHFTDSFRPFATEASFFKMGYVPGSTGISPAYGLFEHPNSMATYLFISICITFAMLNIKRHLIIKLISLAILVLALYWSYSKAQVMTLMLIIVLYISYRWIRSAKLYVILLCLLIGLFIIGSGLVVYFLPSQFGTLLWRFDLWNSVIRTIEINPLIMFTGNGDTLFASLAIWPQPHNIYLNTLLLYGIPGLLLLLTFFFFISRYGLILYSRRQLRDEPILFALWLGLLGYLIFGLVESSFIGIESRMIFFLIAACFIGIRREIIQRNRSTQIVNATMRFPIQAHIS